MDFENRWLKRNTALSVAILFTCMPLCAATPNHEVGVYLGDSAVQMNKGRIMFPTGEIDTLHGSSNSNDFTWGVNLAYDMPIQTLKYIQDFALGLDIFGLNASSDGAVYQYNNPNFNSYNYQLNFQTIRYMLDGTLSFNPIFKNVSPFLKASIGIANIRTSYQESPSSFDIVGGELGLPGQTTNNFAYSFGAGIKKPITEHLYISALYLYTDLGSVNTSTYSRGNNATLSQPITTSLYANSGFISLSWLF